MINEVRDILAKRLKEARESKKYTQRDLGLLVGLSDKSISAYEKGKVIPPLEILVRIAKELEKPVSYFLEEDIDPDILVTEQLKGLKRRMEDILEEVRHLQEKLHSDK